MKPLDILACSLEGTSLIEASAGTGKTFTIAGLYLRLIVEKKLLAREILVVTFTVAATQELRDRIRRRLRDACRALSPDGTVPPGDELLSALAEKHRGDEGARERLIDAVRGFDQAAIYTIHGFCGQVLADHAYESGSLFDTELVTDAQGLMREIVEDYWRINFYDLPPLLTRYLTLEAGCGPDDFTGLLKRRPLDPGFRVIPEGEMPDAPSIERSMEKLLESYKTLKKRWGEARPSVQDILLNDKGINRGIYKAASIPGWMNGMDAFLDDSDPLEEFENLDRFTAAKILSSMKKGFQAPSHPLFDRCGAFMKEREACRTLLDHYLVGKRRDIFAFYRREMARRREERNVRTFDDLLTDMHAALSGSGESGLARAVRGRFRAALIDEFQDTDALQYDIFHTIFGGKESALYLIGDPKQSIYGFRGADIFSYIRASRDAATAERPSFTLLKNWRSDPGLIEAVNLLFSGRERPFLFPEIGFYPASPAEIADRKKLLVRGRAEAPLRIWFVGREESDAARKKDMVNKGTARSIIGRRVCSEIARLIARPEPAAMIGDRPIRPGDIAILVRTNDQARYMQKYLGELSLPSVLHGAESVFGSPEAREVQRVMEAAAEPGSESLVRAALATGIFGLSGHDLFRLAADEGAWEKYLDDFRQYHEQWSQGGFFVMFRALMREQGVRARLLLFRDGERRMTNLLHVAELVHNGESESKPGMDGLIKWLSEKRKGADDKEEEHQLRLETDEDAVRIVTVHGSKGLEYPIVFCPFLWEGSARDKGFCVFHDPGREQRLTLDLGSGDRNSILLSGRETLSENIRLFYVALTRAKYRCYLAFGKIKGIEISAAASTFYGRPEELDSEDCLASLADRVDSLGWDGMYAGLEDLALRSKGAVDLEIIRRERGERYVPPAAAGREYACREFTGAIRGDWRITSFSALAAGRRPEAERPDYDADAAPPGRAALPAGFGDIASFPAGSEPGHCIHEIFEKIDFASPGSPETKAVIAGVLDRYGFDPGWAVALRGMVGRVLTTPLEEGRGDFLLSGAEERLSELEFYFPLSKIAPQGLADVFARHQAPDMLERPASGGFAESLRRLEFTPLRGFVRGFIDLVFRFQGRYYIIDWKSNRLGDSPRDYGEPRLREVMVERSYVLQYHLYAAALHRHLAARLPGYEYRKHFGGVFYIFVRGVDPALGPGFGVFRDRPAPELMEDLSRYLAGGDGAGVI